MDSSIQPLSDTAKQMPARHEQGVASSSTGCFHGLPVSTTTSAGTFAGRGESGTVDKSLSSYPIAHASSRDSGSRFKTTVEDGFITLSKQSPDSSFIEFRISPIGTESEKPNINGRDLAALAICGHEGQKASLSEIINWIERYIPYYTEHKKMLTLPH